jgi:predicted transglutaminase-like cysteine proteinase
MQISIFSDSIQIDAHAWRQALNMSGLTLAGMACVTPALAAAPCPTPFAIAPSQAIVQPAAGHSHLSSAYSKSEAILLGSVSRLDQLREQQAKKSPASPLLQQISDVVVRPQAIAALSSLRKSPFVPADAADLQPVERPVPSFIKSEYALASLPQLSLSLSWTGWNSDEQMSVAAKPFDSALPAYGTTAPTEFPAADCLNSQAPSYAFERNHGQSSSADIRPGQPDVFGTVALRVSRTALDGKWRAASQASLASHGGPWAAVIAQNRHLPRTAQIRNVNAWVNQRIAYVEDVRQYGAADHWSSAVQSLRRGRGDCEDYAIAKMQILRTLGVAADSMFLVIARDLVRRADHAILAVAVDGDLVVLDNETDRILSSTDARDYRPILSFNTSGSWTHGYRTAPPAATLRYASLDR